MKRSKTYYWHEYNGAFYLYFRETGWETAGGDPTWARRVYETKDALTSDIAYLESRGYAWGKW